MEGREYYDTYHTRTHIHTHTIHTHYTVPHTHSGGLIDVYRVCMWNFIVVHVTLYL